MEFFTATEYSETSVSAASRFAFVDVYVSGDIAAACCLPEEAVNHPGSHGGRPARSMLRAVLLTSRDRDASLLPNAETTSRNLHPRDAGELERRPVISAWLPQPPQGFAAGNNSPGGSG
jgi:hypothetical protein